MSVLCKREFYPYNKVVIFYTPSHTFISTGDDYLLLFHLELSILI